MNISANLRSINLWPSRIGGGITALQGSQRSPEREGIFQAIGNPVLVVDPEYTILDANLAAIKAAGISAEEMKGKKCYELFHNQRKKPKGCLLERMLLSGRCETGEVAFEVLDAVFLVSCAPLRDESGILQRIILTMADITEMKHREEALQENVEAAKRLAQENQVVSEIGRIISSSIYIEEVYERFSREVQNLIPFDRIVINTIDLEKENVINVYMAGKGIFDRKVGEVYPLRGSGNAEMVHTRSIFLLQIDDIDDLKERFPMLVSTFEAGFRSIMNVPLFSRGRIVGGLLLRSYKPNAYTREHLVLAERVGNQIAGAIANARLFLDLKRTQEEREKLIQELQEALVKVKTLSGLLPICASCKKIRDDKGYWTMIESYIQQHSDAEFSHGICPECARRLYPDFTLHDEE